MGRAAIVAVNFVLPPHLRFSTRRLSLLALVIALCLASFHPSVRDTVPEVDKVVLASWSIALCLWLGFRGLFIAAFAAMALWEGAPVRVVWSYTLLAHGVFSLGLRLMGSQLQGDSVPHRLSGMVYEEV